MWHEARRQERLIRGMMVDYKKRAERRREYYEKIKQDPTQFLRIHARASKIHLDPAIAAAAEGPLTMMPWQGDASHQIDRFDVRAHLDYIPQRPPTLPTLDEIREEQKCNYERYRTLVHNDHAGISEEQCLHQIYVEEMFPDIQKRPGDEKEKLSAMRAAIGFTYDEGDNSNPTSNDKGAAEEEEEDDSDSDSDVSFSEIDLDVVIDVEDLTKENTTQLNVFGEKYGMAPEAFVKMLEKEKIEADDMRRAKEDEEEKAMFSGRKSRRERRAIIERKLRERKTAGNSPPSYAARGSPTYDPYPSRRLSRSSSSSRDNSPEQPGKVTFITSFGGDEEDDNDDDSHDSKGNKDKNSLKKSMSTPSSSSSSSSSKKRPGSVSSSLTRSTDSHSKSWHNRDSRRSSTRSLSPSPSRSRDRSSSYRYDDHHHRGRSPSNSRVSSRYRRRSCSRSDSRSRSRSHDRYRRSRSTSRDRRHSQSYSHQRSRSRSPSRSHHYSYQRRARSRSRSRSMSRSRSRSASPAPQRYAMMSTLSSLRKEAEDKSVSKAAATPNKPKLTQREKLKLKMQKALNKQHKADKIKEYKKKNTKIIEQEDRDNELREQARKMRQREREKREKDREERGWRRSKSRSRSRSRSYSPPPRRSYHHSPPSRSKYESRSRSRSRSPPSQYRY